VRLHPVRVELELDGTAAAVAVEGPGTVAVGPLDVVLAEEAGPESFAWRIANRGDEAVAVRSVAVVFALDPVAGPLRMFRHGYQSWSSSGVAVFGVDRDPTTVEGSASLVWGVHHADPRRARDDELRSEWVTVLADDGGAVRAGFDDGASHDGTWRLRRGDAGPELWAEAYLGGALLRAGEARRLHPFSFEHGDRAGAADLLGRWADRAGRAGGARTGAPYQVGWCSWYQYFHGVTEADLRSNLARAGDWPFEVFQLDDGYQAAIGDWLETNERFPSRLDVLAADIAAAGRRPGLWLAPFLVAPDSQVATEHPDWLARLADGTPLPGMLNPDWGGGRDGIMYTLDTTHPEVVDHLEAVAATLVGWGFTYLKLDFTFAPSFDGIWFDPTRTPAERVRAGYEAVRRGAGEDCFLLGCGVPLANVVGLVDGNRIGADVAPRWEVDPDRHWLTGYAETEPATVNAYVDTCTRAFMHRRLWLNDPDCLMLRAEQTELSADARRAWAETVAVSGGMALVSDDLSLLGGEARELLDEVITVGRHTDAAARRGEPARCPDLMDHPLPRRLEAAGYRLTVDPEAATSTLEPPAVGP
jgi:alpha-galactosidase